MWWKITLQIVLAFGCLFFGWNFWATIKCWQYRKRLLSSPALLEQFAITIGYKRIFDQSGNLLFRSDLKNVAQFESECNSALVVAGNVLLLGTGIVSALSYVLHPHFLGIDIAIFWWGCMVPINQRMKQHALRNPRDPSLLVQMDIRVPAGLFGQCSVQNAAVHECALHRAEDQC
jgi:hypothetical protein